MFALPGILLLVLVDYVRPQEYFAELRGMPLLHYSAALAFLGFAVDLRLGLSRRRAAPHLPLVILLFAWSLVTLALRAPTDLIRGGQALLIPMFVYALVAHGVQSFRSLQAVSAILLLICSALAALGVEQGLAPYGCHRIAARGGSLVYLYDGRPCADGDETLCEGDAAEPGADYACEKVGLLGTQSDHGRVRYRGTLQDPNELSLAIGIALPFAFAFLERRRSAARALAAALAMTVIGSAIYFTQSRGGQLVFGAVLAVYFIHRMGVRRGLAFGLVLALPLLMFGGRSGGESSTMERLECWWVGLHLMVASPVFGVGFAQFPEHHYLTAHNSLILVGAELGLPGMLLWTSILYVSFKIPIRALRSDLPNVGRSWAIAMLASMSGLVTGSFFLSYAYKDVLWLYVGLTGVLYHAMKLHDPAFTVKFGWRDLGFVVLVDAALVFALVAYTGSKLGW